MSAKAQRAARRDQLNLPTPVGRAVTDSDVIEVCKQAYPEAMSRKGICDALGRHKTPTLINRINRLVDSGYLTCEVEKWPNGARGYCYTWVAPRKFAQVQKED